MLACLRNYAMFVLIDWYLRGFRGTAKLLKKFEVIMILPYLVKYALLRIGVPYFKIRVCFAISNFIMGGSRSTAK